MLCKNFVDKWAEGFFDPVWQSAIGTKTGRVVKDRVVEVEGAYTHQSNASLLWVPHNKPFSL